MAIQASKTCKVWILLNPSMCYSGYFWDTGRRSSVFLKFYRVLMTLLWYSSYWKIPPLQHGFSLPFIVCFYGSRVLVISLFCPSELVLWQFLRAGLFPFFSWFSSFSTVSLKVTCWLSIPGRPWATSLQSLFLQDFSLFRLIRRCCFLVVIIPK